MNQTKKRLNIINLSIPITDIETIELQISKLELYDNDEKLQDILTTLRNENYALAQSMITTYIDTPNHEILQRTLQEEKKRKLKEEQSIIDEFNLLNIDNSDNDNRTKVNNINLDDMLKMEKETSDYNTPSKPAKEYSKYDSLLNISSNDVLKDNITIDISQKKEDNIFIDEPIEKYKGILPDELLFNQEKNQDTETIKENTLTKEKNQQPIEIEDFDTNDVAEDEDIHLNEEIPQETESKKENILAEEKSQQPISIEDFDTKDVDKSQKKIEIEEIASSSIIYPSIPYIDKKIENMKLQYPPVNSTDEIFANADEWLLKIANFEYTEADVEEIIYSINAIRSENIDEATQMLHLVAATKSTYAYFTVARELYKGELLKQNIPEAYSIIYNLAVNDDYPEAICDLAQFYEYGINVDEDIEKAELLYKEASNLGVKRADKHFKRLHKYNKGFLSFLRK